MNESDGFGVQRLAVDEFQELLNLLPLRGGPRPGHDPAAVVGRVTEDRVMDMGQMDPDLVGPARAELNSPEISVKTEKSLESLSALVRSKLAADAASTLERHRQLCLDGIKDEATRETILGSVAKRSALVFGWSEAGEAASVSINLLGSMPDRSRIEVQVHGNDSLPTA